MKNFASFGVYEVIKNAFAKTLQRRLDVRIFTKNYRIKVTFPL